MAPIAENNHLDPYEQTQTNPDLGDQMNRTEWIMGGLRPVMDGVFAAFISHAVFIAGARIGEERLRKAAAIVLAPTMGGIVGLATALKLKAGISVPAAAAIVAGAVATGAGVRAGVAGGVLTGIAVLTGERIMRSR